MLARRFLFQTIHDVELMLDRERHGRASPTAAVIDSQMIKAPHAAAKGYDAAKKIVGRKRYIAVDTDGRLRMVNLTSADSAGAQTILDAIRTRWPWVKQLFAAGAKIGSSLWTSPPTSTSCSRSSGAATMRMASRCPHGVGSSSGHSGE